MKRMRLLAILCLVMGEAASAQQNPKDLVVEPIAGKRWALLIGVEKYSNIRRLDYCDEDVGELAKRLRSLGFDRVVEMSGLVEEERYRPYRDNIEVQLELLLGKVDESGNLIAEGLVRQGDLVVVVFTGHGVRIGEESFLCPTEARLDKLATLLPLKSVFDHLRACKAARKLFVVDACQSPPRVGAPKDAVKGDEEVKGFAKALETPPEGVLLLTSCTEGQRSWESAEFGHGVFTKYLLERFDESAAQGNVISALDLYHHATRLTTEYVTAKHNDLQTPKLFGNIAGDFVLGRLALKKPEILSLNFTLEQSLDARAAWAKYLGKKEIEANSVGMKLVLIPAGEFEMGSPISEEGRGEDEGPVHRVRITKPFYLGMREVTVGEFKEFVNETGHKTDAEKGTKLHAFTKPGGYKIIGKGTWEYETDLSWLQPGFGQTEAHPVVLVSHTDATAFCEWLSQKEGKTYRLPTEAEWEYACRAGTKTRYWYGNDADALQKHANAPNAFGIQNMHGNVWEWCLDRYGGSYYEDSPLEDPPGPSDGPYRVGRGGGFSDEPGSLRSAHRRRAELEYRRNDVGFRVVREIQQEP